MQIFYVYDCLRLSFLPRFTATPTSTGKCSKSGKNPCKIVHLLAYFFEISTNLFLANIGNKVKKGVHIFGLCCTGVTDNIKDGGFMRDRPGL